MRYHEQRKWWHAMLATIPVPLLRMEVDLHPEMVAACISWSGRVGVPEEHTPRLVAWEVLTQAEARLYGDPLSAWMNDLAARYTSPPEDSEEVRDA